MLITKEFKFDSAHFLTDYHGKCEHLHGHTYLLRVTLDGEVKKNGMVVDFAMFKKIVEREVIEVLDHNCLNDIMKNPTAENTIIWIWDKLKNINDLFRREIENGNADYLKKYFEGDASKLEFVTPSCKLHELKLWETETSYVTYNG